MKDKSLKLNLAKQSLIDKTDDPLSELKVIYRLEVGPVKVEQKRLIAPYKVIRSEQEDSIELIYSYEDIVFDPEEPESQNLAGMIAAQVALNYGLFCDSIVFHGVFDDADRKFIRDMAENTACEIYVKKFLQPNPFMTGKAAELPLIKKEHYLQAKLIFPDQSSAEGGQQFSPWTTEPGRYTILSGGGKGSLLSFGLMRELGYQAHPVFGYESGRSWFTAQNAYRYFSEHIPHTSRVSMNSDRVFSRILHHLPFIRQDNAGLSPAEYPIRLWTAAVFLFGLLPLLRKSGIGNLIVGNEYDSTDRTDFKGITHYNGLYDQSRYFDETLTEYYRRKGWNIHQFSLLRPLSEMLSETILVNRYPDLQAQQVSCVAPRIDKSRSAGKEGERVSPCGRCEKCRRMVGMLKAMDADPTRCGYSPGQIQNCLEELAKKGVHHPEILKLRFHPEKSPLDTLPDMIRRQIYQIYMEHAGGALQYDGKKWVEFDPLKNR